jgi:hypothetical protein
MMVLDSAIKKKYHRLFNNPQYMHDPVGISFRLAQYNNLLTYGKIT